MNDSYFFYLLIAMVFCMLLPLLKISLPKAPSSKVVGSTFLLAGVGFGCSIVLVLLYVIFGNDYLLDWLALSGGFTVCIVSIGVWLFSQEDPYYNDDNGSGGGGWGGGGRGDDDDPKPQGPGPDGIDWDKFEDDLQTYQQTQEQKTLTLL